jgi:nicotinamidase-related amidase
MDLHASPEHGLLPVIDVPNDFCPEGAVAVADADADADAVVPAIATMREAGAVLREAAR